MIKIVYTILETGVLHAEETGADWRKIAQCELQRHGLDKRGAKIIAISSEHCDRCGGGDSLVGGEFICARCNSR